MRHELSAGLLGLAGAAAWLACGYQAGRWWAVLTGAVVGVAMLYVLRSGWSRSRW